MCVGSLVNDTQQKKKKERKKRKPYITELSYYIEGYDKLLRR